MVSVWEIKSNEILLGILIQATQLGRQMEKVELEKETRAEVDDAIATIKSVINTKISDDLCNRVNEAVDKEMEEKESRC